MFLIAAFLIQVVSSTPAQASCNVATAQRYIRGFNEAVRGESVLAYIAKNARLFKECYTSVDARNNPVFDSSQLATVGGPAVDREAESLERACMTSRGGERCRKDAIETPIAFLKSMSLLHAPPKYTGKERNPQYLTAGTQSPRLLICCLFDGHKQAFLPQTLVGCLTMNTIAMNWCRETGPRQGVALEASDRELVSQARTLCKDPEVRRVRFLCSDAGEPVIKLSPAGEAAPVGSEAPN